MNSNLQSAEAFAHKVSGLVRDRLVPAGLYDQVQVLIAACRKAEDKAA